MTRIGPCDCLNRCGDDTRVHRALVRACPNYAAWQSRARIVDVAGHPALPRVVEVVFDKPPTEDDLRALRNFDRWPQP